MNLTVLQDIQNNILQRKNNEYLKFLKFVEENTDPLIAEFLEKYLEWHTSGSLKNYGMFGKVIYQDSDDIFANLMSFVGNYFLDDAYFVVKWYRSELVDREVTQVSCNKDYMFAYPVVESDNDNGTQNPRVILDAMKQFEENEKAASEYWKNLGWWDT